MPNSETRNTVLGVNYRLFSILRQNGWWNWYYNVDMTVASGTDEVTNEPIPANTFVYIENQKPFVFTDEFNEVWPSGVVIYVDDTIQDPSTYSVDYYNARVTFPSAPAGAVTADLAIYGVNVREGYPADHELELLDLPVIAYEPHTDDGHPFIIGSPIQLNRRYFNLYIMGRNSGEREDLMCDVRKFIRFVPYVDYSDHRPLNENYGLDLMFSYADQLVSRTFVLGGINGTYLQPKPGGSDKERYRALVAFEIELAS